jgi:adenylate kinase family enzyme
VCSWQVEFPTFFFSMGNAVPCLFPSTQNSFPDSPFNPEGNSNCFRDDKLNSVDLQRLRLKILRDISLKFSEPTIIILYTPPEFQVQELGTFISLKVGLPLLDLDSLAIRKFDESKGQDSDNLQCAFEYRVLDSDCRKGFVIIGYPETPKQLHSLQTCLPSFVIVPLFIDLDSDVRILPLDMPSLCQAMRSLRDKFDRWVHEPTRRSYHVVSRPPKSLQGKLLLPTSQNMLDDYTGDPLVHVCNTLSSFNFVYHLLSSSCQLSCDNITDYKKRLLQYQLKEALMMSCFAEDAFTIPSCSTKSELHG